MRLFWIAAIIFILSACGLASEPRSYGVPGIDLTEEGIMIPSEGIAVPSYGDIPPPLQLVDFEEKTKDLSGESEPDQEGEE